MGREVDIDPLSIEGRHTTQNKDVRLMVRTHPRRQGEGQKQAVDVIASSPARGGLEFVGRGHDRHGRAIFDIPRRLVAEF